MSRHVSFDVVLPPIFPNQCGFVVVTHGLGLDMRLGRRNTFTAPRALEILRHCLICAMERVMISEEGMTSIKISRFKAIEMAYCTRREQTGRRESKEIEWSFIILQVGAHRACDARAWDAKRECLK
jgi:hypothetical protein